MADSFTRDFDVIVVGGGHAGIEACLFSAIMGSKTLLITLNLDRLALCHAIRLLAVLERAYCL